MRFVLGFEIGSIIHEFLNFFLLPAYIMVTFVLMDHVKMRISMWDRQYDYDEDFRNRFLAKGVTQRNVRTMIENVRKGSSQTHY